MAQSISVLEQGWVLREFPEAEVIDALVGAFDATMRVPLRRFVLWADPVREVKGSWDRSREKALAAVREGHRGDPITTLLVSSWVTGGTNWNPSSQVNFTPAHGTGRVHAPAGVALQVQRRLDPEDDAGTILDLWASAMERWLPTALPVGDAVTRMRRMAAVDGWGPTPHGPGIAGYRTTPGPWSATPIDDKGHHD